MTTAWVTLWPRYASAVSFILVRIMAEISSGVCVPPDFVSASALSPLHLQSATHKLLERLLMLDLDHRLASLVLDLEWPVLDVALDIALGKLPPDQALGVKDRVLRVLRGLVLGGVADEALLGCEANP